MSITPEGVPTCGLSLLASPSAGDVVAAAFVVIERVLAMGRGNSSRRPPAHAEYRGGRRLRSVTEVAPRESKGGFALQAGHPKVALARAVLAACPLAAAAPRAVGRSRGGRRRPG